MRLRKMMKRKRVGINPAWSFIEIEGIVHTFRVDKFHSQARDL